jgi:dienelactone hydrolase
MSDDDLQDFERETFTFDGKTRDIYRLGTGPAVIVIAEMPGITPKVAGFARRVAANGMTAVMPHLFGHPGREADPSGGKLKALSYGLSSMGPACVSKEFATWATGKTSVVIGWLRALANKEHERCGGPGVGAVGMCFTGGYALAMAADPVILAPVLSQPSMPVGITKKQKSSIDISDADLATVTARCANEDLQVLGLRFKSDRFVPPERFQFLRDQLGDAFIAVELEDADANPDAGMPPHSVLTEHLVDEPGTKTRQTLDQVLDLFKTKLGVA